MLILSPLSFLLAPILDSANAPISSEVYTCGLAFYFNCHNRQVTVITIPQLRSIGRNIPVSPSHNLQSCIGCQDRGDLTNWNMLLPQSQHFLPQVAKQVFNMIQILIVQCIGLSNFQTFNNFNWTSNDTCFCTSEVWEIKSEIRDSLWLFVTSLI